MTQVPLPTPPLTPKQFLACCEQLARRHGRHTTQWRAWHSIDIWDYEDAGICIHIEGSLRQRFSVLGKVLRQGRPEELLLASGANGTANLGYGELYLRWTKLIDDAGKGHRALAAVDLGNMGFLVSNFQPLP